MTFRKTKTEEKYQNFLKNKYNGHCIFCREDDKISEFNHWILVENTFPYDRIAESHTMLATKRHISDLNQMSFQEQKELNMLLDSLTYDMCILNNEQQRSVPDHLHFHLIKLNENN